MTPVGRRARTPSIQPRPGVRRPCISERTTAMCCWPATRSTPRTISSAHSLSSSWKISSRIGAPGRPVRAPIALLADRRLDPAARLGRHVRPPVDHLGHGRHRHAGLRGDLRDRRPVRCAPALCPTAGAVMAGVYRKFRRGHATRFVADARHASRRLLTVARPVPMVRAETNRPPFSKLSVPHALPDGPAPGDRQRRSRPGHAPHRPEEECRMTGGRVVSIPQANAGILAVLALVISACGSGGGQQRPGAAAPAAAPAPPHRGRRHRRPRPSPLPSTGGTSPPATPARPTSRPSRTPTRRPTRT